MDLERRNTHQLRLDSYITLVDIQKFLEQQQNIAQPEQYVRYQPGGKKGKIPVLSIDAHKGTRKELQAFLADVRGRGERWGIGAETLFGKDAKALANLVSACKKPKLATVDRINRYLEPIAGLQRRNFPLANRHARAWEKHKVEIWPGLGRENIATKPGKASKTKDTEGRPQAEQLYHVVAKVLSRLPQHFELVADIDTIENVITSAVTLLTKEEKAILAGASLSYYLPDLKNKKIAAVCRDILPLMRMKASDKWEKGRNEADAKTTRAACLKNLQRQAEMLCRDRGIDSYARSPLVGVESMAAPVSPRRLSLRVADLKDMTPAKAESSPEASSGRSSSASSSIVESVVGTPASTPGVTPTVTPNITPRARKPNPVRRFTPTSSPSSSPSVTQGSLGASAGETGKTPPLRVTVSPQVRPKKLPPSSPRENPETVSRMRSASQPDVRMPPVSPETGGEGGNRRTQKVHAMRRHSYKDMWSSDQKQTAKGLDDSLSMDELEQLLEQFDPNLDMPAGRVSIQQYWNASRKEIEALLMEHYSQRQAMPGKQGSAETGKKSVPKFLKKIDAVLNRLPEKFLASELKNKMGEAVRASGVWLAQDKKIVQVNASILNKLAGANSYPDELQYAIAIAATCSMALPRAKPKT